MLKKRIKNIKSIRNIRSLVVLMKEYFKFNFLLFVKKYIWFFREIILYKKLRNNKNFSKSELYPCLNDNISHTPTEPTYSFQDTWAAKKIFELKPKHHYDVGSSVKTIGILSQFMPITMVDIRPIKLKLDNLYFKKGSVLQLPFANNSIYSLSSLCVIEHIGLGRYGDELDSFGSEKAIYELKRVVEIGGVILISIPVDKENKVYFNAHRAFTRDYILKLFDGFILVEEKYIYGTTIYTEYKSDKGFGTGLYLFKKRK